MHGLETQGATRSYTDIDGDRLEISAIDDNNGHPVVALDIDSEGNLVHIDVAHVEDFVAAMREKAAEARIRFGSGGGDPAPQPNALQELTEALAEGGHGDNAQHYAMELLARYRAELDAEQVVSETL